MTINAADEIQFCPICGLPLIKMPDGKMKCKREHAPAHAPRKGKWSGPTHRPCGAYERY